MVRDTTSVGIQHRDNFISNIKNKTIKIGWKINVPHLRSLVSVVDCD